MCIFDLLDLDVEFLHPEFLLYLRGQLFQLCLITLLPLLHHRRLLLTSESLRHHLRFNRLLRLIRPLIIIILLIMKHLRLLFLLLALRHLDDARVDLVFGQLGDLGEEFGRLGEPVLQGLLQGQVLELVLKVGVCSRLQEYLDDLTASIQCSPVQRCVL